MTTFQLVPQFTHHIIVNARQHNTIGVSLADTSELVKKHPIA